MGNYLSIPHFIMDVINHPCTRITYPYTRVLYDTKLNSYSKDMTLGALSWSKWVNSYLNSLNIVTYEWYHELRGRIVTYCQALSGAGTMFLAQANGWFARVFNRETRPFLTHHQDARAQTEILKWSFHVLRGALHMLKHCVMQLLRI